MMKDFSFTINDGEDVFHFEMKDGLLCVDEVEYEKSACPETYALVNAYNNLLMRMNDE